MVAVPRPDAPASAASRLVRARGELDISTLPELETSLVRAFTAPGPPHVVLDMREVTFLDCTVVRLLLRVRNRALAREGSLALVCGQVPVGRLLGQLGLTHRLPAYASVTDARSAVQTTG